MFCMLVETDPGLMVSSSSLRIISTLPRASLCRNKKARLDEISRVGLFLPPSVATRRSGTRIFLSLESVGRTCTSGNSGASLCWIQWFQGFIVRPCCPRTCPCAPILSPVGKKNEEGVRPEDSSPRWLFLFSPPFKTHVVLWLQAFLKVISCVREQRTGRHFQV